MMLITDIKKINKTIRQTSIDCYKEIVKEGLLSKMRLQYYEAIMQCAPCTSGEAYDLMIKGKVLPKSVRLERTRFSELRDLGAIKEVGVRRCNISNRKTIVWDLTDQLPNKKLIPKKKDKDDGQS